MWAIIAQLALLQSPAPPDQEQQMSCGLASCYLFLQSVNGSVSWDSVSNHFSDKSSEVSFLELKKALNNNGVDVVAIDTKLENLKALRCPAIVQSFLGGKDKKRLPHFQVLIPYSDSMLLLDPMMGKPLFLDKEVENAFAMQFTGKALVESRVISSRRIASTVLLGLAGSAVLISLWMWRLNSSAQLKVEFSEKPDGSTEERQS